MTKAIYFDMDGTIANFYGVDGWLESLQTCDPRPYAQAAPLLRLSALARILNRLQKNGYKIGIVSWLAKNSNDEFDRKVTETKIHWLKVHMKSVRFDEIHIVKYGTPKETVVNHPDGILFDDEMPNRRNWKGEAYDESKIMEVLKSVAQFFLLSLYISEHEQTRTSVRVRARAAVIVK